MKVKLGEWQKIEYAKSSWSIDTPVGLLEVKYYRHWQTLADLWRCGLSCGSDHDGEANWILGEYTDFETADEAKAFIIDEYEKLVLSLIEGDFISSLPVDEQAGIERDVQRLIEQEWRRRLLTPVLTVGMIVSASCTLAAMYIGGSLEGAQAAYTVGALVTLILALYVKVA